MQKIDKSRGEVVVTPELKAADWQNWRWQLRHAQRGLSGLAKVLNVAQSCLQSDGFSDVVQRYRFQATPYYLSLIDWQDAADPIRRQCLPDVHELDAEPEYKADPFAEIHSAQASGIVHRYPDRVLLPITSDCAVYCRHCTRKNTLDGVLSTTTARLDDAIKYIRDHKAVREVLISGGDPLLLEDNKLSDLLSRLYAIEHVEVVRIGTRVPVVLPMRIDSSLVEKLRGHGPLWINTQFNHPRELTPEAVAACAMLTDAGIPVSNQSVLLKGVNDDFETMHELCAKLQRNRIRPYYVFHCDPIVGIRHLRTDIATAKELEHKLWQSLGGLALPRFVADVPGKAGKLPVACL
jgi:lysine 2,3-aminomutase